MDYLKDFLIHFVGLSIGNHRFEFEIDDKFFEQFEYSQLHRGQVNVTVDLDKQDRMMVFSFEIEGLVEVTCDRCGEEFMFPISGTESLIVKFGNEYADEDADIIVIPSTEYKIDLAPYFYEYIHLLLPAKIVHPNDAEGITTCNPEALRILEKLAPLPSADPRWEALVKLKPKDSDPPPATDKKQPKKK